MPDGAGDAETRVVHLQAKRRQERADDLLKAAVLATPVSLRRTGGQSAFNFKECEVYFRAPDITCKNHGLSMASAFFGSKGIGAAETGFEDEDENDDEDEKKLSPGQGVGRQGRRLL